MQRLAAPIALSIVGLAAGAAPAGGGSVAFSATATPARGAAPLQVALTAAGAAGPVRWDFGDGTPAAEGATVTHTYVEPGVYTATAAAVLADGTTAEARVGVTALRLSFRAPPVVGFERRATFRGRVEPALARVDVRLVRGATLVGRTRTRADGTFAVTRRIRAPGAALGRRRRGALGAGTGRRAAAAHPAERRLGAARRNRAGAGARRPGLGRAGLADGLAVGRRARAAGAARVRGGGAADRAARPPLRARRARAGRRVPPRRAGAPAARAAPRAGRGLARARRARAGAPPTRARLRAAARRPALRLGHGRGGAGLSQAVRPAVAHLRGRRALAPPRASPQAVAAPRLRRPRRGEQVAAAAHGRAGRPRDRGRARLDGRDGQHAGGPLAGLPQGRRVGLGALLPLVLPARVRGARVPVGTRLPGLARLRARAHVDRDAPLRPHAARLDDLDRLIGPAQSPRQRDGEACTLNVKRRVPASNRPRRRRTRPA